MLDCRDCQHSQVNNPASTDRLLRCNLGHHIARRKNEYYGDCEQNIELCSECGAPVFRLYLSDGKCRECEGA